MTDTTETLTLSDFLAARIDEDQRVAMRAAQADRYEGGVHSPTGIAGQSWIAHEGMVHSAGFNPDDTDEGALWDSEGMDWRLVPEHPIAEQFARWDPARVLAECEAKRRMVENERRARALAGEAPIEKELAANDGPASAYWRGQDYVLRLLALPYVDHPDYREEWKP